MFCRPYVIWKRLFGKHAIYIVSMVKIKQFFELTNIMIAFFKLQQRVYFYKFTLHVFPYMEIIYRFGFSASQVFLCF